MNMWRYYPLFLVALATASIIFQVVGFTSTGWLIIRHIGSISVEENTGAGLNISKQHTQANEDTTNERRGAKNEPVDNGVVPIPESDDNHIGNIRPGNTYVPIDNGSISIPVSDYGRIGNIRPGRTNMPIDDGGVPISESDDGRNGNIRHGKPNKPIDNGGVTIPESDDGHIDNIRPGKPNLPIDTGGEPIPESDDGHIDNIRPGKPNMPIYNSGVPIPVSYSGHIGKIKSGKPNLPIDTGGVPIQESDDGHIGTTRPERPNMPIDNDGVPIHVSDESHIGNIRQRKPTVSIDNGDVPIPETDDSHIANSILGRPNVRPNVSVPISDFSDNHMGNIRSKISNAQIDKGGVSLPDSEDEIINEDQNNNTHPIRPQHKFPNLLMPTPNLSRCPNGNPLSTDINRNVPPKRPGSSLVRPKLPSIKHPSRNSSENLSPTDINGDFPTKRPVTSPVPPSLPTNLLPKSKTGQKAAKVRSHVFPNTHVTPITKTSMQNFRHQTSTLPIVESAKHSESTPIQRKSVSDRKDIAKGSVDRQTQSYENIEIGLWVSRICEDKTHAGSLDCSCNSVGFSFQVIHGLVRKDVASDIGGMATWNDLRVETMLGLIAGIIGLAGSVLTVKPLCLKDRRRMTTTIGICGMALSCVLFLVPVARVVSIYSTLKESFRYAEDAPEINTPYAAVISGIGACLALITAGLLALSTWADEKQKWRKFEDEPPIVFTKHTREDCFNIDGICDNTSFKINEN